MMSGLFGAAFLVTVALWNPTASVDHPSAGGDTAGFTFSSASPLQLHKRVADEPRDPDWSEGAEEQLRAAYLGLPGAPGGQPMAVRCGTSLCEVSGDLPEVRDARGVNVWMVAVQKLDFSEKLISKGLIPLSAAFGSAGPGVVPQYVGYWRRG